VRADVVVTTVDKKSCREPERVAYEICVNSLRVDVVARLLAEGFSKVVIVVDTAKAMKSAKDKILDEVGPEGMGRVEFLLEEEVVRHLPRTS
jgi:hypothetical protein